MKEGDFVDCYDSTRIWYASTVLKLETRQVDGQMIPSAFIAYRVPDEKGDKTDKDGKKFFGWDDMYDEWLTLHCPLIAPF